MQDKTMKKQPPILNTINSPADLRRLPEKILPQLAAEIRREIIETVARSGGHLAPSLGVVELTLALHYIFNTPTDKLIWDVGHQSYAHKLITGRRELFHTLRQYKGISGFPKRSESPYDTFDPGHSSTSLSAGLGISSAKHLKGDTNRVIAVIGDGSMTGGMAFEALNQAGHLDRDLIVVLNDNEMSISANVGALSSFLSRKMTGKTVVRAKEELKHLLKSLSNVGENILQVLKRTEESFKTFFTPGMLFEALKFEYVGPIPGHQLDSLLATFKNVRDFSKGPVLIHVLTTKGKGYPPAEKNPGDYHGVGPFDILTGTPLPTPANPISYTRCFGDTLVHLAEKDQTIIAITAAMPAGTGLTKFAARFPDRFFDVGIAEQHAVTFAAGLATEGMRPVVAVYSTFFQRALDQVIHDVCLPNLPVTFALDRSGVVGDDGPTHHGMFDIAFLRYIPNLVLMAPKDENELQHMLYTAVRYPGPVVVRYPRGEGEGVALSAELEELPLGKGELLRSGNDVLLLPIGNRVFAALTAADGLKKLGIEAAVINPRFIKPLDGDLIAEWAAKTGRVVTVEDAARQGGFGSTVLELLARRKLMGTRIKMLGFPDQFVEHGPQDVLRKKWQIDAPAIINAAMELLEDNRPAAKAEELPASNSG
ncbi:MAG: 1-deoxy-D-xylulose-5-phosphate synthase [Deltaproteobacteria bacterium RIFOXYD12_FULL_57_12]|nr:MAG: 1-deoxy-D-xylulose-5-phosphate synthase [Deltaproteobacteria bacterium RIFOXYD12_FULL_57_12]